MRDRGRVEGSPDQVEEGSLAALEDGIGVEVPPVPWLMIRPVASVPPVMMKARKPINCRIVVCSPRRDACSSSAASRSWTRSVRSRSTFAVAGSASARSATKRSSVSRSTAARDDTWGEDVAEVEVDDGDFALAGLRGLAVVHGAPDLPHRLVDGIEASSDRARRRSSKSGHSLMARMKARPFSSHERHAPRTSASVHALASVMTTASYCVVRASRRPLDEERLAVARIARDDDLPSVLGASRAGNRRARGQRGSSPALRVVSRSA